jgi:osmotically-inducible protein OsmY
MGHARDFELQSADMPGRAEVAASPEEVKRAKEGAFMKSAESDAQGIHILVNDSRVVLEGKVRSWAEAPEAEEVAWALPGTQAVENRLELMQVP